MQRIIALYGIIAFGLIAAACRGQERITISREMVEVVPADPVVIEKTTTIQTETRESDD